jgi:hypothetical protein
MLIGLEIGLLIGGLIALVTGKFKLGKDRVAVGVAAWVAGLVLMLPLPMGFAIGFAIGLQRTLQGQRFDAAQRQGTLALVEWGLVGVCALLGFAIALAARPTRQHAEAPEEAGSGDEPEEGITAQPPRPRAAATVPPRGPRRPSERPRRAAPSGLGVVWWVVGGCASVFLLLVVAGGLVLSWALSVVPVQQAPGPAAGPAWPGAGDGQPAAPPDAWAVPPAPMNDEPDLNAPAKSPFAVDPRLAEAGAVCYLRDMRAFDSVEGNEGWAGVQVLFEGRLSPHALVLTPAFGGTVARRRYALGKQAHVFRAGVGFTDDPNGHRLSIGPAVFLVLSDGKELWKSKAIAQNGMSDECTLDVSNVEVLELRVRRGWGPGFSAPVWIEPRLFKDRARADDDPPAGLARGAPEPAPAPKAVRRPLKEDRRQVDDAAVTTLRLGGADGILPCLCWSGDGRSFFYLDGPHGVLGQAALDGLEEVRRLEVGGKCSWLSASAEGLLVAVAERSQVWVVDPERLRVKARLDVPGAERAVSAPGLSLAFARGTPLGFPGGAHLYVLDLKAGTVSRAAINGLPDKFLPAWQGARVTGDGKYLFTHHTELSRFRIDGPRLIYEDTGPNVVGGGRVVDLALSPDGRFACLPAGGGNDIAGPFPGRPDLRRYSLYVYPVRDLQRPAFPLEIGAYPTVVGFDPVARLVYAKNSDHQLMVFDETGQPKKQYQISNPTDEVRQFLAHPKGRKLLLLANKLYLVELGGE